MIEIVTAMANPILNNSLGKLREYKIPIKDIRVSRICYKILNAKL